MRFLILFPLLALLGTLSGCGSAPTYQESERAAVSALQATFQTYNASPQATQSQTEAACRRAQQDLQQQGQLNQSPPTGAYQRAGKALQHAYQSALAGFTACASAGPYDYLALITADGEFARANAWLTVARQGDPHP